MRLRLKALLTLCALCAALITGSTMAWFTDEVTAADTVFTAGTVDISADRLVTGGGEPHYYTKIGYCVKCLDQNDVCRDRKFKNNETGRANVLSILTSLNPVWISSRYYSFYTLGSGGTLTLKLNTPMTAGSGQRVIKYLSGGDSSDSGNEKALLEVSADGRDYTAVETLTKNTQMVTISIPDTILFDIRYIRITDLPQPASPSTRCCCPPPPCSDDGYDLAWLECGILGGGTWNPGTQTSFPTASTTGQQKHQAAGQAQRRLAGANKRRLAKYRTVRCQCADFSPHPRLEPLYAACFHRLRRDLLCV